MPAANGLSDGVIAGNSFAANAGGDRGGGLVAPDYQVTLDESAGWRFYDNGSFSDSAHPSCGELHMVQVGSSVINNNKFDISWNKVCNVPVPPPLCGPTVESIVLELGASRGFTFSGNIIHNEATGLPSGASCWDALEVKDDNGRTARGTVGDNAFTNKNSFSLNAIHYESMLGNFPPLVAIGNAFSDNVAAPSPTDPTIILGAVQYLTMTANGSQTLNSTKYFPVSGFLVSNGLTEPLAEQSWGQSGAFTVAQNCGRLGTAPGGGSYTFQLFVNGAAQPVTCTFTGSSTVGSGNMLSTGITAGQTVSWQATQGSGAAGANPTINLIFARQ